MSISLDRLSLGGPKLLDPVFQIIQRNFERIQAALTSQETVRAFISAAAGATSYSLPDGNRPVTKTYHIVKTDSSANAVTVYPYGTQTIEGASSHILSAQYDSAFLVFDKGTQTWYLQ